MRSSLFVALIFGLIVYDITQTALEAWVWVVVQLIVASGIVVGTVFAARAVQTLRSRGENETGTANGARILNSVLSIIFAAVVTGMSLGYGASAIEQLRYQPVLSLSAYSDQPLEKDAGADTELEANLSDVRVVVDGRSLKPETDVTVTFEPGAIELASQAVDMDGWANAEFSVSESLPAKTGALRATATDALDRMMTVELNVAISDDKSITFAKTYADSGSSQAQLLPVTANWVFNHLLPALVLLLLVIALLFITLNARNRDDFTGGNTDAQDARTAG